MPDIRNNIANRSSEALQLFKQGTSHFASELQKTAQLKLSAAKAASNPSALRKFAAYALQDSVETAGFVARNALWLTAEGGMQLKAALSKTARTKQERDALASTFERAGTTIMQQSWNTFSGGLLYKDYQKPQGANLILSRAATAASFLVPVVGVAGIWKANKLRVAMRVMKSDLKDDVLNLEGWVSRQAYGMQKLLRGPYDNFATPGNAYAWRIFMNSADEVVTPQQKGAVQSLKEKLNGLFNMVGKESKPSSKTVNAKIASPYQTSQSNIQKGVRRIEADIAGLRNTTALGAAKASFARLQELKERLRAMLKDPEVFGKLQRKRWVERKLMKLDTLEQKLPHLERLRQEIVDPRIIQNDERQMAKTLNEISPSGPYQFLRRSYGNAAVSPQVNNMLKHLDEFLDEAESVKAQLTLDRAANMRLACQLDLIRDKMGLKVQELKPYLSAHALSKLREANMAMVKVTTSAFSHTLGRDYKLHLTAAQETFGNVTSHLLYEIP